MAPSDEKPLARNTSCDRKRSTARIQLVSNLQATASDALNLPSAVVRDNVLPLPHGGERESERPRDIRGALKVLHNVMFQHEPSYTAVKTVLQPQSTGIGLTSVAMEKRLITLAERLSDAMGDRISNSELARACGVSPAAVGKWLDGQTKTLKSENFRDASRALGVREEWLRDGKLPRERTNADEESQIDEVLDLLEDLRSPLSALAEALDRIGRARPDAAKRRKKA